ncbi:glycosyltransferase family 39 protein [Methanocella arvoryzae]|uniref:Glycosyltransferase (Family 39) n=1 Tax=Methanocella arvoryzae (strain DSM 22066 / NBRC 105507 / MRE50) TaxID=351160 RepID=Q0W807_METAR|nr:glycosyltransferase family 39 protein [Methanocella arvoryzae]CAJ35486.1 putative glycosyltransferase (family 39) [Methanocella arvoryzae MRE50]
MRPNIDPEKRSASASADRFTAALRKYRYDLFFIGLILVIALGVRLYGLMDAGITWDEPLTVIAGMKYAHNFLTLNFSGDAWSLVAEHGPISKYIYAFALGLFLHKTVDYETFVIAKAASTVVGAAVCVLVYLFCREFLSRRIAVASALILALTPVFVAHTQIAAVDGPVALFFTLTMYLFLLALKTEKPAYYIASAISLGLLIDTKYNGLIILPVLFLLFLIHRHQKLNEGQTELKPVQIRGLGDVLKLGAYYIPVVPTLLFLSTAAITMFVAWPWLWTDTFNHLIHSLTHWTYIPEEYFLGQLQVPPKYYYLVYFLVTTPEALLLLALAGGAIALKCRGTTMWALLLWLIVPFSYNFTSFIQDGMRYLLMIYPALAILCAVGIDGIAVYLAGRLKKIESGMLFSAITGITLLCLIASLLSVAPYYLDYYNYVSGGPASAYEQRNYEFSWWGEGLYDSVLYLEKYAPPGSTVFVAARPNTPVEYYAKNHTYILWNIDDKQLTPDVRYLITNQDNDRYHPFEFNQSEFRVIYETKVQGLPLATVYEKIR